MTLATPNTSPNNLPDPLVHDLPEKLWTPEELLQLPDAKSYELVDGKLVERQMGVESSEIAIRIAILIGIFLGDHKIARIFGMDLGYQCFPDDPNKIRRPDVSIIKTDRLPPNAAKLSYMPIPPDLAIEVVSPNDLAYEVDAKVREYLAAGVRLIWVVNPEGKTVRVYSARSTQPESIRELTTGATITGEDVLPGFSCPVDKFFTV